MNIDVLLSSVKLKMNDTLKIYNVKTKETVISQGTFRREILAESVFALKEISENLINIVNQLQTDSITETCKTLVNEIKSMKESLSNLQKSSLETTGNEKMTL